MMRVMGHKDSNAVRAYSVEPRYISGSVWALVMLRKPPKRRPVYHLPQKGYFVVDSSVGNGASKPRK